MESRISYWDNTGKYQTDLDRLTKEHMPESGEAETIEGELIRAVNRLYYEYCNNGNCNAAEREHKEEFTNCHECGGSGKEEQEFENDEGECEMEEVDCPYCDGEGGEMEEWTEDPEISEFYCGFLTLIEKEVKCIEEADAVRKLIVDPIKHYNYDFDQKEMDVYNNLTDKVVEFVLRQEKAQAFRPFKTGE